MSYATKLRVAYARMMGDELSMPTSLARVGDEADAEIAALRKRAEEADADKADAQRYRWLRDSNDVEAASVRRCVERMLPGEWDAAIDAARKETP